MTWEAASFALLVIALTAGFAWYERSRPPAKVVAPAEPAEPVAEETEEEEDDQFARIKKYYKK